MAAASLIASAFGIILLILAAYFLTAGAVSTIEVISNAQKETTQLQVRMLGTSITLDISNSTLTSDPKYLSVVNTGNEPIRDYTNLEVFLQDVTSGPVLIKYSPSGSDRTWKMVSIEPSVFSPAQWDPGERLNMSIYYTGGISSIQVTTANGISARSTL